MEWIILLTCILGTFTYVQADCYPGDTRYNQIIQNIYRGVTSDNIHLVAHRDDYSSPLSRTTLCNILVNRHNHGTNRGMQRTNANFLGTSIPHHKCLNALIYTQGYYSLAGWRKWDGRHRGRWYAKDRVFEDDAQWYSPTSSSDDRHTYSFQKVRFDSQERKNECTRRDSTGATCRNGWNQSGTGIQYVWGWDPKNNECQGGNVGSVVGSTFSHNGADCIVWVSNQEAFLECVCDARRTSAASGPGTWEGYGQWTLS